MLGNAQQLKSSINPCSDHKWPVLFMDVFFFCESDCLLPSGVQL